jgi:Domain of unknown function (DUF3859)
MTMGVLLAVLLALALSDPALAEEARVERIDIVGKGLYRVEPGKPTPEAGAPTGSIDLPLAFTNIEKTDTVPARIGVEFGLEYRIVGEPTGAEVTLEFVVSYPEAGLADPDSPAPLRETRFERMKPIGEPVYFGYGFEKDWELVPGTWTFEIRYDGRKLAEERFTVAK